MIYDSAPITLWVCPICHSKITTNEIKPTHLEDSYQTFKKQVPISS